MEVSCLALPATSVVVIVQLPRVDICDSGVTPGGQLHGPASLRAAKQCGFPKNWLRQVKPIACGANRRRVANLGLDRDDVGQRESPFVVLVWMVKTGVPASFNTMSGDKRPLRALCVLGCSRAVGRSHGDGGALIGRRPNAPLGDRPRSTSRQLALKDLPAVFQLATDL